MIGRRDFALAGLSAAALAALQGAASAQQPKPKDDAPAHHDHEGGHSDCAEACSDCQQDCDSCATHCAHQLAEGKKDHITTLMTCRDCAAICAAAAQVVASEGPMSSVICDACAKACDMCAQACEKFPHDKHMKMCADSCRKCAAACRTMVKAA